jgi:type VI secretion system FHA domain protein
VILTLELSGAVKPGVAARKVFTESGGTIGRDAKSFWVLPDGEVSGRHALISCRNGVFFIEDTNSTNGISINSVEDRLVPSRRYPLTSGDRIFIRPYVITVNIAAAESQPVRLVDVPGVAPASGNPFDAADPFRSDDPFAPVDEPLLRNELYPTPPAADGGEELNPLNLLPGGRPRAPRKPGARALSGGSLLESNYRPPDALAAEPPPPAPVPPQPHRIDIPHGYDPVRDDSGVNILLNPPPPPPRPRAPVVRAPADDDPVLAPLPIARPATPPPPMAPIVDGAEMPAPAEPAIAASVPPGPAAPPGIRAQDFQAVLEGAGLDGSLPTAELERMFGEILRVVVSGVMEMLRARQEIKDEFRMHLTQFRPTENNPLKFSANVEDALHNLLVKRNAAYLGPVEAFSEAFEDLRHHQIAMLEGMRAAFEAMLEEFDPDTLQKEFDRQGKSGALLSVPAKLRYWDMYRERCRDLVQDKDTTFRKLFGEEFAQAYEVQLRRLKATARGATRDAGESSRAPKE